MARVITHRGLRWRGAYPITGKVVIDSINRVITFEVLYLKHIYYLFKTEVIDQKVIKDHQFILSDSDLEEIVANYR